MKNTIISEPIQYYILDESINADNYQENAVRLEIKLEDIQNIFHDTPLREHGLIGMFENVSTIPNYENKLEFVSSIWVKKSFYEQVKAELKLYHGEHVTDIACFILKVLVKINSDLKRTCQPIEITPEMEYSRFIKDIMKKRSPATRVKYIELTRGSIIKKYEHADFILEQLGILLNNHFLKNDLDGLFQHFLTATPDSNETVSPGEIIQLEAKFRKLCLLKIFNVTRHLKTSKKKKYLLINQLFALCKILDYSRMKIATELNEKRFSGNIRSQIEELKQFAKKRNTNNRL